MQAAAHGNRKEGDVAKVIPKKRVSVEERQRKKEEEQEDRGKKGRKSKEQWKHKSDGTAATSVENMRGVGALLQAAALINVAYHVTDVGAVGAD